MPAGATAGMRGVLATAYFCRRRWGLGESIGDAPHPSQTRPSNGGILGPKEGVMSRKPQDDRYEIVGFCWSFVHAKTGRRIYARNGRPFPIKRRRR